MSTMNVSLPAQMKKFVRERVKAENYGNASEYIRTLIREDQRRRGIDRLEDQPVGVRGPVMPEARVGAAGEAVGVVDLVGLAVGDGLVDARDRLGELVAVDAGAQVQRAAQHRQGRALQRCLQYW